MDKDNIRNILNKSVAQRRKLGLTQSEIAKKMKISQPAVARIESGEVNMQTETLMRYLEAVGLSVSISDK